MSVSIYTNYFFDRLTANHARLLEGTLGAYEYYESISNDAEMKINDSKFKLTYRLRIDIADKERTALPVPKVTIGVTYEAYETEDTSILSPSASKTYSYDVQVTKTEFNEQVSEAIDNYREFVNNFSMPQLDFDFWPQTAKLMKQFEKIAASTARDNSDKIALA